MRRAALWAGAAAAGLLLTAPTAGADPVVTNPIAPFGGEPGIGTGPGIDAAGPGLSPAAATIFLCPGVGAAANVVGGGGGYCDFNFVPVAGHGTMHEHCEWGGMAPLIEMWNCWRVFPGQPDHPAHPDPDIIPDGFGVPYALLGPSPSDQWPPPGLAPAAAFAPPEPVGPEPPEPPPG